MSAALERIMVTAKGKPRCKGRACGTKVMGLPGKFARYEEAQCARACADGTDYCSVCFPRFLKAEAGDKPLTWHGDIGGPLPNTSLIIGGPRNVALRARAAEKAAAEARIAAKAAEKAAAKAEKAAAAAAAKDEKAKRATTIRRKTVR
jgi:hypothetical protein